MKNWNAFFPKECKNTRKITSALWFSLALAKLGCEHQLPGAEPPAPCRELAGKKQNHPFPSSRSLGTPWSWHADSYDGWGFAHCLCLARRGSWLPSVHQGQFRFYCPWLRHSHLQPRAMFLHCVARITMRKRPFSFLGSQTYICPQWGRTRARAFLMLWCFS